MITFPLKLETVLKAEDGDVDGRLLGVTTIGGCSFHIEAIEVTVPNDKFIPLLAVNESLQNRIEAIAGFDEGAGSQYQTVLIHGKHYFIVAHPFQR